MNAGHPGWRPGNGGMSLQVPGGVRCRFKLFSPGVIHVFPIVLHHICTTSSSYCTGGEWFSGLEVSSVP